MYLSALVIGASLALLSRSRVSAIDPATMTMFWQLFS
jgi:hypothetical protein